MYVKVYVMKEVTEWHFPAIHADHSIQLLRISLRKQHSKQTKQSCGCCGIVIEHEDITSLEHADEVCDEMFVQIAACSCYHLLLQGLPCWR